MTDYREFQDGELVPGTRYRVTRLVGSGGMGRVYEVEHEELGKRFVLKALLRELSRREDLVARLRNEWRALARLEHPNIVGVTDAGMSDTGVPFYVMERLEGETLSALLHRQRRLHPQRALGIAASILQGLHAAHQIGVVHRDVKPPNIFVTGAGAVKVLDFGIAKIKDAKGVITARGIAVGTPRYMSPEQAQGSAVDARSDIYATGLMLFEMLSGVGPFDDARDNNELLLAHLGRPAPLLSSICVVAPELDAVVAGLLAKDPRERPGNAQQVAETLNALAQRYAHFVATDAPTVNVTPRPTGSLEGPTRQDGVRRSPPTGAATRPDGPAALARAPESSPAPTTSLRPALESATTLAQLGLPSLVTGTLRLSVSEVLEPPTHYGADTLVDSVTSAPTGVPAPAAEHTEPLIAQPLLPGQRAVTEAPPTRTAVPAVEPNLTPPPVVPTPAAIPERDTTRRWPVLAAVGAGAGLFVAAGWLWGGRAARVPADSEVQAAAAAAAAPASSRAVSPEGVPEPSPSGERRLSAAAPVAPSALPPVAARMASKKAESASAATKPGAAPVGRDAPAGRDAQAPQAGTSRRQGAGMPGSGL